MSTGVDSVNHAGVTVASPEVLGFMAAKRTPRARATRKVEAVAHRLIAGGPPLDRARSLWVCCSYARGAPDVGDVDLLLEIDEPRDRAQQAVDAHSPRVQAIPRRLAAPARVAGAAWRPVRASQADTASASMNGLAADL